MHHSKAAVKQIEDTAASGAEIHSAIFGLPQIRQRTVYAKAAKAKEQNEGSEPHLKTKPSGWIGGFGSTSNFTVEEPCG